MAPEFDARLKNNFGLPLTTAPPGKTGNYLLFTRN
jgi:hypothetical protein